MNPELVAWKDAGKFFSYNGQRVFYRRGGPEKRTVPTVLAIHGYPLSSWDWSRIWAPLTAKYNVVACDMLGFGFSDKDAKYTYSVRDQASLQLALLNHLGIARCTVLAHDMGNSVAQELLARVEEKSTTVTLQSLCFLNGGLFSEAYTPRVMQRLLSSGIGHLIGPRIPKTLFCRAISEVFGSATKPSRAELALFWELVNFNEGLKVTHLVGRFIHERKTYRDRWVKPMQHTSIPMRFINGPRDPNSGIHMVKRYRELIANPDVVLLPEPIGHWPQLEASSATAEHILAFVDRVTAH